MDVCMMLVTLGGGLLPPTPPKNPSPFRNGLARADFAQKDASKPNIEGASALSPGATPSSPGQSAGWSAESTPEASLTNCGIPDHETVG